MSGLFGLLRRTDEASPGPGRGRSRQDGQIVVVFAGGIVLLFLMAGLVIDGGTAFLNRRDAQNTADVAALAGTKQLTDYYLGKSPLQVYETIERSAIRNGCTATCTWTARYVGPRSGASFRDLGAVGASAGAPPAGALGVKVDVTRRPHTYFLGVIGQSTWTIDTTATAASGRPEDAPADQLLPIAIWKLPELKTGTVYALTNGKDAPGNFGWLAWFGTNSSKPLADSICTPNNPSFALPAWFPGDPGKTNSSAVRACLQQWVDRKEAVLVPIIDQVTDTGNKTRYHISAIAAFTITGFSQPAVDQINGRFEGTLPYSQGSVVPGGITEHPSSGDPFYYIGLTQ
jgi:Flp pilus assembly protein TadG